MSTTAVVATFAVVWWIVFFMALPFGVSRDEAGVPGTDSGAPARPHMLAKVLATTALAALATWGVAYLFDSGIVDFRPPAPP